MTGGAVVVLGPVGANFGAGMTGGRAYLYDPSGRHAAALDDRQRVGGPAGRGPGRARGRPGPPGRARRLLEAHRDAGSALAARLLDDADLAAEFWLVEPIAPPAAPVMATVEPAAALAAIPIERSQPGVSAQLG